ncbi:hypothetical protein HK098_002296 [Nowakowskiella sp. JEL0407]|nr:hypothetical protein HK098_002296 [Nowakowskiella sp. JEL0407]
MSLAIVPSCSDICIESTLFYLSTPSYSLENRIWFAPGRFYYANAELYPLIVSLYRGDLINQPQNAPCSVRDATGILARPVWTKSLLPAFGPIEGVDNTKDMTYININLTSADIPHNVSAVGPVKYFFHLRAPDLNDICTVGPSLFPGYIYFGKSWLFYQNDFVSTLVLIEEPTQIPTTKKVEPKVSTLTISSLSTSQVNSQQSGLSDSHQFCDSTCTKIIVIVSIVVFIFLVIFLVLYRYYRRGRKPTTNSLRSILKKNDKGSQSLDRRSMNSTAFSTLGSVRSHDPYAPQQQQTVSYPVLNGDILNPAETITSDASSNSTKIIHNRPSVNLDRQSTNSRTANSFFPTFDRTYAKMKSRNSLQQAVIPNINSDINAQEKELKPRTSFMALTEGEAKMVAQSFRERLNTPLGTYKNNGEVKNDAKSEGRNSLYSTRSDDGLDIIKTYSYATLEKDRTPRSSIGLDNVGS